VDPLQILVAEDHPLFRKGVISLLSSVPEFEFVGEATSGEQAIARATELQPDEASWTSRCPAATA